ncbi:Plant protein of unknown function (DUF641 [Striga hermonthica]|uniref:GIL1/IRKI C-terminal domain-containing protein n=1 Tax=Striga hermonthica TaxID=68872 RepID=A0A9N7NHA4_STRHE|nr:Plant protein of unknown function (DUF641 [Striga hermonthica]
MFHDFDKIDFGLCNDNCDVVDEQNGYMRQLIEHVTISPMEILSMNKKCGFSRFCERKYVDLVHPTMECSIFRHLDRKEKKMLDSWKPLSVFHELFVMMASSIWLLHKLAYTFNPMIEIFQVERGFEFSMVYMENVLGKKGVFVGKSKPTVGFTVVPGFKVSKTVVQSQGMVKPTAALAVVALAVVLSWLQWL